MNLDALIKNKALNWTDLLDTPSSITANEFVRGNGAGTDLVQFDLFGTSNIWTADQTFDNASLLMGDNPITNIGYMDFNLVNGIAQAEGRVSWNDTDGTLNLGLKGGVVNLQIGQEQVVRGKNASGSTITNGKPVRISGASGSNPEFGLSDANNPATAGSIGLTTEDILNNSMGYVTTFGLVRDIDTTGTPVSESWNDADRLYVSDTAGELTNVMPSVTSRIIFIGIVLRSHATEGVIWVNPVNVSYISELSGITISSIADDDFLKFNSGTGIWENFDLFGTSNIWTDINTFNTNLYALGLVGIGNSNPQAGLHIGDGGTPPTTVSGTEALYVEGNTEINNKLYVNNTALLGGVTQVNSAFVIDLLDDTISQWKMNDNTENTIVVDSVGTNTGTAQRNTSLISVAGKINEALNFNGTTDYINCGTATNCNFTSEDFSASFWTKPDATQASFASYIARGLSSVDGWIITSGSNTQIAVNTWQSGAQQQTKTANGSLTLSVWNHVVVRRSGTNIQIFINSVEVSYAAKVSHTNPTGNASRNLVIGSDSEISFAKAKGHIDIVAIYDKFLLQSDIDALYNSGNGIELLNSGTDVPINAIGETSTLMLQHILGETKNLLIEGDLEVQGQSYFSNDVQLDANLLQNADNLYHYFGATQDASITFDGSDLIINSENITANDEIHFTNFDRYLFDNKVTFTQIDGNEFIDSLSDGDIDIEATTAVNIRINGSEEYEFTATQVDLKSNNLITTGIIAINADAVPFKLGAGGEYHIEFDTGNTLVFNEDSGDFDFRVEGLTAENLFFIDASTNRIGINSVNTDAPEARLHLTANEQTTQYFTEVANAVTYCFGALGGFFKIQSIGSLHGGNDIDFVRMGIGVEFNQGKVDMDITFYGDTAEIARFNAGTDSLDFKDNKPINLGTAQDVSIFFDTSDLIINSENITANDEIHFTNFDAYVFDNDITTTGQGTFAKIRANDKLFFTQVDENEYIDSETDGDLDISATTGIDFNIGGANDMRLTSNSLDMQSSVITDIGGLHFNSTTELTISGGAVSVTQGHHKIDTEADAANDDLDTINDGNAGEILLLVPADDDRTIRIRHGIGNIFLKHQVEAKSFSFSSPAGSSGVFYSGGYYNWEATDANLTQASISVTHSAANVASACHIGIVAGGAGVVDTGVVKLTVSGTTMDDEGNRLTSQTVILVADITTLSLNEYVETTEKWLGQVTIALATVSGSPVNFNLDLNYGCSKYEDFGNQAFTINVLEIVGLAGANDSGFNLRLFHHNSSNWTYAATGFVPGGTVLASMNSDYSTESELVNGESFAYKRVDLNTDIAGELAEGLVLEITTTTNKAVEIMDMHFEVHTAPNFSYMSTLKQHLIFMKHGNNWLEL